MSLTTVRTLTFDTAVHYISRICFDAINPPPYHIIAFDITPMRSMASETTTDSLLV